MRLKSVKLTHFRGYRATTVISIDEATADRRIYSAGSRLSHESVTTF